MAELPQEIPKEIILHCKRLQAAYAPDGTEYDSISHAVRGTVNAGANEKDAIVLLVGLLAAESWLEDDRRQRLQLGAQSRRDLMRDAKNSRFGKQAFDSGSNEAKAHSVQGIRQIQTLLMFGFALRCGTQRMSKPIWRPLASNISRILSSLRNDDEDQILEAVRQRIRRWKRSAGEKKSVELAKQYFSGVYVTLYPRKRRPLRRLK